MLDIPDDLLYDIFTINLRMIDVCGLDSALCNKKRRPEFLRVVSTKVLLFNREYIDVVSRLENSCKNLPLRSQQLAWILKRGINLASLQIRRYTSDTENAKIRKAVASLVRNGQLDRLETIDAYFCSYIKDQDLAALLSTCNKSVKSIDLRTDHKSGLTTSSAAHIKRCTRLEAFGAHGNESAADLVDIFQACPKLRYVDLQAFRGTSRGVTLMMIEEHCAKLEALEVAGCPSVSGAGLALVAKQCSKLKSVTVYDREEIVLESLYEMFPNISWNLDGFVE
jgi:hypothetical protein